MLRYAVDEGADRLIDLATLTGSCVVALGEDVAGAFTNDQAWCDDVLSAAKRSGEEVWQLPMFDHYAEQLKSDVADVKNTGARNRAGAITAAKFLEKFVDKKRPWVHLDIAGPAFAALIEGAPRRRRHRQLTRTLVKVTYRRSSKRPLAIHDFTFQGTTRQPTLGWALDFGRLSDITPSQADDLSIGSCHFAQQQEFDDKSSAQEEAKAATDFPSRSVQPNLALKDLRRWCTMLSRPATRRGVSAAIRVLRFARRYCRRPAAAPRRRGRSTTGRKWEARGVRGR